MLGLGQLGTLVRTLRHLRCSQLLWRLRRRLERRGPRAAARWRWADSEPPHVRADVPDVPLVHRLHPAGAETVADLAHGVFEHLHRRERLGRAPVAWQLGPVRSGRLWTVTLYYHEWARALAEAAAAGDTTAGALFEEYLSDWLARCGLAAPGAGVLAWNAYAVATRIASWVRSYHLLGETYWTARSDVHGAFLGALWEQAAFLHDHLEFDLRANHLLRDAVGLAWAGRFFEGPVAERWLRTATELAIDQAHEQVLPDGGHFERSPMYHLHVMEDVAVLALLLDDHAARARLRGTWAKMAECLAWLRHPDSHIPLLNDAALNGAAAPDDLLALGPLLGITIDPAPRRGGRLLADTGLAAWHGAAWSVFFDVGAVGPNYQPGHAHADTLTLECSWRGRRLFVDPGTLGYDDDAARRSDRSTAAHNTVSVDGHDSSEVWHIFRVGRRAFPVGVRATFGDDGFEAAAAHTGFDHLPGAPRHARQLRIARETRLDIVDRITGASRHVLTGGLLLAPGWHASAAPGGWDLHGAGETLRVRIHSLQRLALTIEDRPYHPEFGMEVMTKRLCWRLEGTLPVEIATIVEPA